MVERCGMHSLAFSLFTSMWQKEGAAVAGRPCGASNQGTESTGLPVASNNVSAPAPSVLRVSDARVLPSVPISARPGRPSGVISMPMRPRFSSPRRNVGVPSLATMIEARGLPSLVHQADAGLAVGGDAEGSLRLRVGVEEHDASDAAGESDFDARLAVVAVDAERGRAVGADAETGAQRAGAIEDRELRDAFSVTSNSPRVLPRVSTSMNFCAVIIRGALAASTARAAKIWPDTAPPTKAAARVRVTNPIRSLMVMVAVSFPVPVVGQFSG